jgi:hypothetical protein
VAVDFHHPRLVALELEQALEAHLLQVMVSVPASDLAQESELEQVSGRTRERGQGLAWNSCSTNMGRSTAPARAPVVEAAVADKIANPR